MAVGIGVGPAVRPLPVPTGKPKVKPVQTGKPKATPIPTGRPKGTPVPTGEPKAMPVPTGKPTGTLVPTCKPKVHPVPTGKPKFTPVPTGRPHRPFPVATDRGCSPSVPSGIDGQLLLSPQQVVLGKHIEKVFTGKLLFQLLKMRGYFIVGVLELNKKVKVTRCDNGTEFKNAQMIKLCGTKGIRREYNTECLVLSKDFKLPDDSMVVLKVPRKHNLYTINLNDLSPNENQLNKKVKAIICDNGTEFKNAQMIELYETKGIRREYSTRSPQQNRVAERKNKTLIEAARTMLADSKLPIMFWTEVVRTACYVLNRVSVTNPHNKTPHALLTGKIPTVSHFKPFGCHVTILNTSDHLGKFDGKADEGYLIGYSASNKAYRVYNVPTKWVEETMNLHFLEDKPNVHGLGHEWYFDLDYLTDSLGYKHVSANQSAGTQGNTTTSAGTQDADSDSKCDEQVIIIPSYPSHNIQGTQPIDTPGVEDVLPSCIPVSTGLVLVPTGSLPVATGSVPVPAGDTTVPTDDVPVHNKIIIPCLVFFSSSSYDDEFDTALNNVDSSVEVSLVPTNRIHTIHPQSLITEDPTSMVQTRNMVKQNPTAQALADPSWVDAMQEEMQQFKFQNVWVLVELPPGKYAIGTKWIIKNKLDARGIVAIRLFLAFASYMGFLVYQMDVKSVFLYGRIKKEVYVTQPKCFVDPQHPTKVYKVVKALYGLHQALRAWYATLSTFLLKHGYKRGSIDKTLFLKNNNRDIILVQVYVDDIVFGSTKKEWFSACSRHQITLTTSNLEAPKKIFKYLKGQPKLGLWYPKESPLVLEAYSDSDYAGENSDRKSTTGGCQFLGRRLISWQCKKQTIVATSSTEAEYVAAANCCGQHKHSTILQQSSMAALKYKEEHNKVGYLLKPTGSDDYHQIIDFLSESHIRGMVNNVENAKKFLMYPRFLQTILGNPMPLLPTMLLQAAASGGTAVAAQDIPHLVPAPDQSIPQLTTPSRPHSPDPVAPVLEYDNSSAQPEIAAGSFPSTEDAHMGADFHTSPIRSSHTPPVDHPSRDAATDVLAATSTTPAAIFADSPQVPPGASNKGKSLMIEEDIPVPARTLRQMEEDRLGEEAARRIHNENMAEMEREKAKVQRKRQHEVLESAKFYNTDDWLTIQAQVEVNASLSKTLLGDDVSEENFPARMAALIKKKRQALAEQLFKERQNRPLTLAQQKAYMRQYVKNQSSAIYNT
nr:hypothetical protein [Tanacetum cinerariifolium]